jgi:hypothetical protein
MTYVLAPNQTAEIFPYSIGNLRRDNPNTSFPRNPSDAVLASWNVFPVTDKPAPDYNPATQNLSQVNPTRISGKWVMTWAVTPATPEQIAERTAAKSGDVRADRNRRLVDCDWTQLPDAPVPAAPWAAYRQELRNVTSQAGFPWDVTWPDAP